MFTGYHQRNAHFRRTRRTGVERSLQKCADSRQKCTLSTDEAGRSGAIAAEVCRFPAEMHTFNGRSGQEWSDRCRSVQIHGRNAHFRRTRRAGVEKPLQKYADYRQKCTLSTDEADRSGAIAAEVCSFPAEMHTFNRRGGQKLRNRCRSMQIHGRNAHFQQTRRTMINPTFTIRINIIHRIPRAVSIRTDTIILLSHRVKPRAIDCCNSDKFRNFAMRFSTSFPPNLSFSRGSEEFLFTNAKTLIL